MNSLNQEPSIIHIGLDVSAFNLADELFVGEFLFLIIDHGELAGFHFTLLQLERLVDQEGKLYQFSALRILLKAPLADFV